MLTGLNHLTLADYTHAFDIAQDAFAAFRARLLEAHVGNLASRLAKCREMPYAGMRFFD